MKTRKIRNFIPILLMVLISCNTETPSISQNILFEKHYVNYAWGYQNNGYLIDSLGNVWTFDISKESIKWKEPDKDGYISAAEMNENKARCKTVVAIVHPDTLNYYSSKIWRASYGKISEPFNQMADAGSIVYSAFIYEEKSNRYKKVMLKTWGDWMIINSAPEAESISQWMQRITTENNSNSEIIQVKYGTSFGECTGYCKRDMELSSGIVTYNCSAWNASLQPITRKEVLNATNWDAMKLNLNTNDFFVLPTTIGCPDCADGGAEWLEIELKNGNIHKVTFEYNKEPALLKDYILKLREMLNANECK